jgi:hypothetical protein
MASGRSSLTGKFAGAVVAAALSSSDAACTAAQIFDGGGQAPSRRWRLLHNWFLTKRQSGYSRRSPKICYRSAMAMASRSDGEPWKHWENISTAGPNHSGFASQHGALSRDAIANSAQPSAGAFLPKVWTIMSFVLNTAEDYRCNDT